MSFGSDNQAPAHPAIIAAVAAANEGRAGSYGDDPWTQRAQALTRRAFDADCTLLIVGAGGAANGLALSLVCPSWGAIVCERHAHIAADEGCGPEFFTGGARLLGVEGRHGRISGADIDALARRHPTDFVHGPQPRAVSLSNATESGAVFDSTRLTDVCQAARRLGWGVHVDGARFANAVATTGESPAALSWRAGVDVLSFGLTKNGAIAAEAVVLFGPLAAAPGAGYLRKRAGQLFSKHRFFAAQFVAMLEDDLWLSLAAQANAMAAALARTLVSAGCEILHPVEANEVFARLTAQHAKALQSAGVTFFPWDADGADAYRFVASWNTSVADVEAAAHALRTMRHA